MREITFEQVAQTVAGLCVQANTQLPEDLRQAIRCARREERSPVGRAILGDLEENFSFAGEEGLPICQDTGAAIVFVDWGQECHLSGGTLEEAVNAGVARGYVEGKLRLSVVGDPLRRVNTNSNAPAVLHLRMSAGDQVSLTVAPKGAGSENMSALRMFNPSTPREEVERFIVDTVDGAGANPCPPVIVGVGLGGTADLACVLAKRALLRPVGQPNPDPFYADMERSILGKLNALGIGPQGLGGTVTALGVAIEPYATHIATLPCAVCFGCHVTRHASAVI